MGRDIITQNKNCKIPDSAGFVCSNLQIQIVDVKTGENLGPNQVGEIWVKSPLMMTGYYRNSEATKKVFDDAGMKVLFFRISIIFIFFNFHYNIIHRIFRLVSYCGLRFL